MKPNFRNLIKLSHTATVPIFGLLLMIIFSSCKKEITQTVPEESYSKVNKTLKDFTQVNLVGDNDEYSPAHVDANLVNGWGISFPTSGPAWVSAEGTGKTTVYTGDGIAVGISPVSIPGAGSSAVGHPTGQVFNGTSDFKLPNEQPARFIFASADGTISGWNTPGGPAIKMVDDSPDAAYLGITLASDGGENFLYVANFSEGEISVYDKNWAEVSKPFTDPNLPLGYSPFNIQNVGGKLYVMYAKVGDDGEEIAHPGFGIADIYNPDGSFVTRFVSNGQLNAPWGIAWAPASFFGSGGQSAILIGNFGDGHINAYSEDGHYLGQLRAHGEPIEIEGLWGISFAPDASTFIPHNRLYFAAGPDDETHGLFGYITK